MEYKTLEELKKELNNKFDEFMYQSNIELVKKIDKAIEQINYYKSNCGYDGSTIIHDKQLDELLNILKGESE